ncbi:hypothetical protein C8Q78DRAFT_79378 [Trametes maxima]|nr:hypothetical protein C8Q78DRAFT_79378 [Trametes maxima]
MALSHTLNTPLSHPRVLLRCTQQPTATHRWMYARGAGPLPRCPRHSRTSGRRPGGRAPAISQGHRILLAEKIWFSASGARSKLVLDLVLALVRGPLSAPLALLSAVLFAPPLFAPRLSAPFISPYHHPKLLRWPLPVRCATAGDRWNDSGRLSAPREVRPFHPRSRYAPSYCLAVPYALTASYGTSKCGFRNGLAPLLWANVLPAVAPSRPCTARLVLPSGALAVRR